MYNFFTQPVKSAVVEQGVDLIPDVTANRLNHQGDVVVIGRAQKKILMQNQDGIVIAQEAEIDK